MLNRFASYMLVLLISLDQLLQSLIVGAWWAVTKRGHLPDPDETISGFLGRHNRSWAVLPRCLIDALFLILTLGKERNHCAATAIKEAE